MKLLFCPNCWDIFKLDSESITSCKCGSVKGRYCFDNSHSISNGKGISIGINNNSLSSAVDRLKNYSVGEIDYQEARMIFKIECWARFNDGVSNPRSSVKEEL